MDFMDKQLEERLASFVEDEEVMIGKLRALVGGELERLLDGSLESLEFLDRYIDSLTQDPNY